MSQQGFEGLAALGVPRAKLDLLYNNADTEALGKAKPAPDAWLKKLGVPTQAPLILAAGMRRPHKGFDTLLEAWKMAVGAGVPGHLLLMGDPANSEPAHEALLRSLAADPQFRGRLTVLPAQRPFAPWLKRADLFVSSSRWEGSPLVVIEAMAAGTPVLATDEASGEILKEGVTGALVGREDAPGLARKLQACSRRCRRRRQAGRDGPARGPSALQLEGLCERPGRPL